MSAFLRTTWLALLVLTTLAYFFWTAISSFDEAPPLRPKGAPETDHFNLLSHGFLNGQLHLGDAPQELRDAPNPYDPKTRPHVAVLHDASYYRGKYYIYFGPAPVVTLFLPFAAITGRDLPLPYAVWFYCSGGFLALLGVLFTVQRRYFPDASGWTKTAALFALGGGSLLVALLRRPHIWELSSSAGFFFFALSLWCLVRALHSSRAVLWAVVGGLALGLAVGSRPTYIVCSVMFALPVLWRRIGDYDWRAMIGAAAGCGAIVLGLLAYNYARFENPLEFGQKYQLSAIIEGDAKHFSLSYIPYNFKVYLLLPLRWEATFPFQAGIMLPTPPEGHGGYEYVIGLLPNLPFALLALFALLPPRHRTPAATAIVVAIGACALLQIGLLLAYFGLCIRYMADFTPCVMLLASIGLFALEDRIPWSGLVRLIGLLLGAGSAVVAAAAVAQIYNTKPDSLPVAYRPVARALNYPLFWWQHHKAPGFGPLELSVSFPAARTPRTETLLRVSRDRQPCAQVDVEYLDATRLRLVYRETESGQTLVSPAVVASGETPHTVRLSIGGDYADFDGINGRLRAQFDAQPLWNVPGVSLRAFPGQLTFGPEVGFTGTVLASHPIKTSDFVRFGLGGARVRFTPTAALAGRWLPLVTSGRLNAADFLALRVEADGRIGFGYDHWGEPMYRSPVVPITLDQSHVIEFWVPAVNPAGELVIKVDDAIVWRQKAPAFTATPDTFFLALNPVGGSTSEPALENAIVEATQLPPPASP